jgi:hypothetical protein
MAGGSGVEAVQAASHDKCTPSYAAAHLVRAAPCTLQVVPVSFPQLLPLCSLDALCLSALSQQAMAHFDAGGGACGLCVTDSCR